MMSGAMMPKIIAEKFAPGVMRLMPKPRRCGANQRETIFGRMAMSRPAVPTPAIAQVPIATGSPYWAKKPNSSAPTEASPQAMVIAQRVPILSPSIPHTMDKPA